MFKVCKKGQLSALIIIGVLVLVSSFILIKGLNSGKSNNLDSFTSNLDVSEVDDYAKSCVKIIVREGIVEVGFEDVSALENYVNLNLPGCVEKANDLFADLEVNFDEIDTKIEIHDVSYNNKNMFVHVDFPLLIEKDGDFSLLRVFEFQQPIFGLQKLNLAGNVLQETVIFSSPDNQVKFKIEKGTVITNKYGYSFDEIWIEVKDKNDYYIYEDNSIFDVVYEMLPNGAQFNPPITITVEYEDSQVNFPESQLTYSWYGKGKWTPYPSSVDTVNNVVTAKVDHFTGGSLTKGESADAPEVEKKTMCYGLNEFECSEVSSIVGTNGVNMKHCQWENDECKPSCGEWLFSKGFGRENGFCINTFTPGYNDIKCDEEKSVCNVPEALKTYLQINATGNNSNMTIGTDEQIYSYLYLDTASGGIYGCNICLSDGFANSGNDEIDLSSVIWSGSDVSGLPIVSDLILSEINVGEAGINFDQSMLVDEEMGLVHFFWKVDGQWYGKAIEHIGAQRPYNVCRGLHYVWDGNDAGDFPPGSDWKVCENSLYRGDPNMPDPVAVPPIGEEVAFLVVNENPEKQERTAVKLFNIYYQIPDCPEPVEKYEDELNLSSVVWDDKDVANFEIASDLEIKDKKIAGEPGMEFVQELVTGNAKGEVYFFWQAKGKWYGKVIDDINGNKPEGLAKDLHYVLSKKDKGNVSSSWKVCYNESYDGVLYNASMPPVGEKVYYLVANPTKKERTVSKSFNVKVENKCLKSVNPVEPKPEGPTPEELICDGSSLCDFPADFELSISSSVVQDKPVLKFAQTLTEAEGTFVYYYWKVGDSWYGKYISNLPKNQDWGLIEDLYPVYDSYPGEMPSGWVDCGSYVLPPAGEEVYYMLIGQQNDIRTDLAAYVVETEPVCNN